MKKLKNFLYYEWKKIIALVFVVVLTFITVKQCSNKEVVDFGVLYAGEVYTKNFSALKTELESAKIISDTNSDGKVIIKTKEIFIPKTPELRMEQQVPQQIQFEIISGETTLFIVDMGTANTNAAEMSFADITSIATAYDIPQDKCLKYSDGKVFAVSLEGNKLLEKLKIPSEGMYIAQRNCPEKDKTSLININAQKAMEYILKNHK